jgi:hypothetical protein
MPLWLLAPALTADEKIDPNKAADAAKAYAKALREGDAAKILDLSYPKVVEALGGADALRATLEGNRRPDTGDRSFEVGKPSGAGVEGGVAYVLVPAVAEAAGPGKPSTHETYLLAVSTDRGRTWTFVPEDWLRDAQVKAKVFPKLPAGLTAPPRKSGGPPGKD